MASSQRVNENERVLHDGRKQLIPGRAVVLRLNVLTGNISMKGRRHVVAVGGKSLGREPGDSVNQVGGELKIAVKVARHTADPKIATCALSSPLLHSTSRTGLARLLRLRESVGPTPLKAEFGSRMEQHHDLTQQCFRPAIILCKPDKLPGALARSGSVCYRVHGANDSAKK